MPIILTLHVFGLTVHIVGLLAVIRRKRPAYRRCTPEAKRFLGQQAKYWTLSAEYAILFVIRQGKRGIFMVRYLHSILLAGLLAGVLALGLGVGAAATAPMEPFVPPKAPTEPSDPETNGEMYGWGTGGASLVYDRSVWYVREKTSRILESGEWNRETYNEHGETIRWEDSSGMQRNVRYCYTPDGALLSDGFRFCAYDAQGRLIDYTYSTKNEWDETVRHHITYRYGTDADGRTYGEKIDADGLPFLRITFDAQDRPIRINYLDQNGNVTDGGVQYTYDAAGRMTMRKADKAETYLWNYDEAGHLIGQTRIPAADSTDDIVRVRYDYDDRGCFLGAYYGDSTTPRTTFHYDAQGRLISWERDEYSCQYTYNEKGQLLRVTYNDGDWQEFSYDAEGRTVSIRSDFAEITYRYARYGSFLDVDESDWYAPYIQSMADKGLLKGMEDGTFAPNANMTVAEAITLAVRMAADEGQSFRQGQPWYQVYIDWAKTHDLPWEYADYNAKITRTEFAQLFAAVYRSSETMQKTVQPINTVPDGSIPDVAMDDANAADIYLLYRLGVLAGSDEAHHFAPDSQILRSEVAAIACRLLNEGRQSFSIT